MDFHNQKRESLGCVRMSYPRSLPSSYESYQSRFDEHEPHSTFTERLRNDLNNNPSRLPRSTFCRQRPRNCSLNQVKARTQNTQGHFEFLDGETNNNYLRGVNMRDRNNSVPQFQPYYPIYKRSSSDHMIHMDPNMNPMFDDALEFVSLSRELMNAKRNQLCAEFVSEHFKCPVCLDTLIEATVLGCGHRFCSDCIDAWLRRKKTCPVCLRRATCKVRQFDIDIAIEKVSPYLSDEWRKRRQMILESRVRSQHSISTSTTWLGRHCPSLEAMVMEHNMIMDDTIRLWEGLKDKGHQLFMNTGRLILYLHQRAELKSVVKGVIIGCIGAMLWGSGGHLINFLQYLFHAMRSYDANASAEEQIAAVRGRLAQISGHTLALQQKNTKFQDFAGRKDTLYVKFIKLFYEW